MHSKPTDVEQDTAHPREQDLDQSAIEAAIMLLLLSAADSGPWTETDLERELSACAIQVKDALCSLHAAGLLHTQAGLVLASRAAKRMDRLAL